MNEHLLKYIIDTINTDIALIEFYNKYYYEYSEMSLNDYITGICLDNPIFFEQDIDEVRKKILKAYLNTRIRLNKKAVVTDRLIDFPSAEELKKITLKSIIDNELKMLTVNAIKSFKDTDSKMTERPISLDGMYSAKERMTLFSAENTLDINNKKAYMSDEKFERQVGTVQPLFFQNDSGTEVVFIKKGEKAYLKSKSIDAKDQKIMDFLIEEYKQIMYYPDQSLVFPLHQISNLIYKNKSKTYLDLTRDRLTKMSNHGFIIFNDDIIFNENAENKLVSQQDNYEVVNMFEIKFFTNEEGIRHCRILISRSIEHDLKTSNTIKLYKHKIDKIANDFTAIFVNYVQSQRINSLLKNEKEVTIPYKLIKRNVILPHSKSKPKNLFAIEEALKELIDMNFLIDSYEVKNTYIKLHFIEFGYVELKELKLESKVKELEI